MASDHAFCKTHRVAYNRRLDPTCPQCAIARIPPGEQLEFDVIAQKPLDAAGAKLDPFTLQKVV